MLLGKPFIHRWWQQISCVAVNRAEVAHPRSFSVAGHLRNHIYPGVEGNPSRHRKIAQSQIRSEEHTSELQSLMRISYAVFCLKKTKTQLTKQDTSQTDNHALATPRHDEIHRIQHC